MKRISKICLAGLLVSSLQAGEIQVGKGNFEMNGGFIGLDQTINADITTYSMIEQHKNIFSSNWFYKYNFTWYDSKKMVQAQNSINSYTNGYLQNPTSVTTPSVDYRVQGLDLNLALGRDLLHSDENNNLGLALVVGASIPWIDSKKSDNNNDSNSDSAMNAMKDSKTELYTYKVGLNLTAEKSLSKYFIFYASGTYAYQTGTMKNSYAKSDLKVNGRFQEYDLGLKIQPLSYDYKLGWFTLSPRLYMTLGYRYTAWDLDDINIDVTGSNMKFKETDFNMNSKVAYFGVGYSF